MKHHLDPLDPASPEGRSLETRLSRVFAEVITAIELRRAAAAIGEEAEVPADAGLRVPRMTGAAAGCGRPPPVKLTQP